MLSIHIDITGTDDGYTGRDVHEIADRVIHDAMLYDHTSGEFSDGMQRLHVAWTVRESSDPEGGLHWCGKCGQRVVEDGVTHHGEPWHLDCWTALDPHA